MYKILLAVNETNLKTNTLAFGCFLARLTGSAITGIFLENLPDEAHPVIREMYDGTYIGCEVNKKTAAYQNKMALIGRNINQFNAYYSNHNVAFSARINKGVPSREMIRESRFADLLVIDPETSFRHKFEGPPTDFVKEVLAGAECPVIIAPGDFDGIDEIIFTCNGDKSASFAMKQFTYFFPQFSHKKVTLVHVRESPAASLAEKNEIKEWLKDHYSDFHIQELAGKAETELFGCLLQKKNVFIVLGAYGRNLLSRRFSQSKADVIIKTTAQAMFITH